MDRRSWLASFVVGWCGLAACDGESEWVERSRENAGPVCFLRQGGVLELTLNGQGGGGSCSRNAEGSCEITRDGDTITVTSLFTWEERTHGPCTFGGPEQGGQAICELDLPPDGTYTVVHGDEMSELTVPDLPECPI